MFFFVGLVVMIIFILQSVAFLTLLERHLLGGSQCRVGPNKVGFSGVLQAVFDGMKLVKKEQLFIFFSSLVSFFFVPVVGFIVMVFFWFSLPYFFSFLSFDFSGLFFFCLVSFFSYVVMLSGVFSGGMYSFVGGLRASAQSYSYEIAFSLFFLIFFVFNKGLFFYVNFCFVFFFLFFPCFIMILVDLHRAPFDFAECESELVSGFNVEYSSVGFAVLFLGEYGNLLYFGCLVSSLFFGFSFMVFYVLLFVIVFCRSCYPRFRFDKLMGLCWYGFLPIGFYFFGLYYVLFLV
uniref:NADH dehydrogenase subunit 1 n=1 Tax=Tetrameres grusi TaxID=1911024 RepID=UPI001FCD3359|nr:NADH dehydrogenase subunit 1 [Tetrameres grusi]UNY39751.1 NADH dehydrogenase subunit 1 [Tetrameres grusi]